MELIDCAIARQRHGRNIYTAKNKSEIIQDVFLVFMSKYLFAKDWK
jgi:hypothetical protein